MRTLREETVVLAAVDDADEGVGEAGGVYDARCEAQAADGVIGV